MKFLPLVWKNIWRRKFRTTFTLLSVFIAFLLFGILMTIRNSFALGVEIAGLDRLVLINKISLIMPLPFSYKARLESVPGVNMVTHNTWFNGIYQDPSNFFANIAVDPEPFLKIYPEYKLPPEQVKAFFDDRQGAIVGRDLAKRFGWKIGDRVPLQGTIFQPKSGDVWAFNISGIYDAADGIDKTQFFFRYDYLEENRTILQGDVGWYIVKIADGSKAVDMSRQFDAMFENSSAETKTTTEKGFVESFAKQIGDIGSIMIAVSTVVLLPWLVTWQRTSSGVSSQRKARRSTVCPSGLVSTVDVVAAGRAGAGVWWPPPHAATSPAAKASPDLTTASVANARARRPCRRRPVRRSSRWRRRRTGSERSRRRAPR